MKPWIVLAAIAYTQTLTAGTVVKPLERSNFKPIMFKNIPETRYLLEAGVLSATVDRSAGAWVQAFQEPTPVKEIRWQWQADGRPGVRDKEHEASKAGDDAVWRIGLMIQGPKPFIPFFASSWIKQVAEIMKYPSDRMLYLVSDARHAADQKWQSPYSSSIENWAVASTPRSDGWQDVRLVFPQAETVVGIWLMADGDDTKSQFQTRLRKLELDTL